MPGNASQEALVSEEKAPVVLGLDMGGTHTDAVLLRGGTLLASVKVPTNHRDLLISTRAALHALFESGPVAPAEVSRATFGTTLAVNAVVQDACAPVGLLIGAGPGIDPGWFGLGGHTAVIPGGVDHRGTEVTPLDREAVRAAVERWRDEGIAAFACVTKFSTRNPAHENAMEAIVREVCEAPVVALGHRLSGRLNFPRRIATAYWNAAVWTLHNRFADAVEASLKDMGIRAPAYLLKADGGAIPLSVSRERPVEALLSGPAASVMGMLALTPASSEDVLVLDMGGTTTDIALLAGGQPVLSPNDLVVKGRSTLVRSLKSVSIGLGGDSQVSVSTDGAQVGPLRRDAALAFGGSNGPTFLDCLNVLGHAEAGDTAASRSGVEALALAHGLSAPSLAQQVLDRACARIAEAVRELLDEVNAQPVYTLAALLEDRAVRPSRAVLVGGPAQSVAPLLGDALGMPVETLGDPVLGQVANAVGAALTRPTEALDLFADTAAGVLLVPSLDIRKSVNRRYTLEEAKAEACGLLRSRVAASFSGVPDIDVTEAQVFATLDEYGRGGRDIRVRCQLRPGVDA